MTRRLAFQTLLMAFGKGATIPDHNVLIDLNLFKGWEIRFGDESILITGKELFEALKGKR